MRKKAKTNNNKQSHQVPESSAAAIAALRDDEDQKMEPEPAATGTAIAEDRVVLGSAAENHQAATGKEDEGEAQSASGTVQVQEAESSQAPVAAVGAMAAASGSAPAMDDAQQGESVPVPVNGNLGTSTHDGGDQTGAAAAEAGAARVEELSDEELRAELEAYKDPLAPGTVLVCDRIATDSGHEEMKQEAPQVPEAAAIAEAEPEPAAATAAAAAAAASDEVRNDDSPQQSSEAPPTSIPVAAPDGGNRQDSLIEPASAPAAAVLAVPDSIVMDSDSDSDSGIHYSIVERDDVGESVTAPASPSVPQTPSEQQLAPPAAPTSRELASTDSLGMLEERDEPPASAAAVAGSIADEQAYAFGTVTGPASPSGPQTPSEQLLATPAAPNSRQDGRIELTSADDDGDRTVAHSFAGRDEQDYPFGTAPASPFSPIGTHSHEFQTPPEQQLASFPNLNHMLDDRDLPSADRYGQAGMFGTASALVSAAPAASDSTFVGLGAGHDPSHAGASPFRSLEHAHAQFSAGSYSPAYYQQPWQLGAGNSSQRKKQTTGDERAAVVEHFVELFKSHFHGSQDYQRTEFKNIGQVQRSVKDMLDQVKDRKRLAARVKGMKSKELIAASNRADACTEQTSLYRHYYCGVLRRQIKEAKQYPDWKTCCKSFGAGGSVSVVNAQIAFANLVDAGNEWLLDVDFRYFRWQKFKEHTPAIFDALRSAGFRVP